MSNNPLELFEVLKEDVGGPQKGPAELSGSAIVKEELDGRAAWTLNTEPCAID